MKKLITTIILILVFSFAGYYYWNQPKHLELSITPPIQNLTSGDTLTILVNSKSLHYTASSGEINIQFDPKLIDLTNSESSHKITEKDGELIISLQKSIEPKENHEIAKLEFQSTNSGVAEIKFNPEKTTIKNPKDKNIEIKTTNGRYGVSLKILDLPNLPI